VRLKPARQLERLRRREDFIERSRRVRVQMVLHEPERRHTRVVERDKSGHKFRIIHRGSSVSHCDIAKAGMGLKREEHAARTLLVIFVMVALSLG
jgi:hypothetical protein